MVDIYLRCLGRGRALPNRKEMELPGIWHFTCYGTGSYVGHMVNLAAPPR